MAIHSAAPATVYAAVGGVLKTTNGGASWDFGVIDDQYVTVLAIDPSGSGLLFAGSSPFPAGSRPQLFKSANGGVTWDPAVAGLGQAGIRAIAFDPLTPSTIYVGTTGGVYKSTNSGASWNPSGAGLTTLEITALAIDRLAPTTIYAGTNGQGMFRSQDGGAIWAPLNVGLPVQSVSAIATPRALQPQVSQGRLAVAPWSSTRKRRRSTLTAAPTLPSTAQPPHNGSSANRRTVHSQRQRSALPRLRTRLCPAISIATVGAISPSIAQTPGNGWSSGHRMGKSSV